MSSSTTVEWPMYFPSSDGKDEVETLFDVVVNLVSPGSPGKTTGDPDDCYEGSDPELEIESIGLRGLGKQPSINLSPILWPMLGFTKDVLEQIEEKALKQMGDDAEMYYEERDED